MVCPITYDGHKKLTNL